MKQQKTRDVVLIHGAFTDGSCWEGVITSLLAKGYHVTAAQIPLTSLADDVAYTNNLLRRQEEPVVLVGHSWGGAVITEAGIQPNVASLVYVSALAPDKDESVMDLQKHGPASTAMQGARPDDAGLLWFDRDSYGAALAADLSQERIRLLAATQKPIAMSSFSEKLADAAWRTKPSWYLLSQADKALAPELQRWMSVRIKATTVEVPSSHMSLISNRDTVVSLIEQAART